MPDLTVSRDEYLEQCKARAMVYAERGETGLAMASLVDDFSARPDMAGYLDTVQHLMLPLALTGKFNDPAALRKFVEDFT